GDPVPHDDPAAGPRYTDHLLRHVERPGGEHRPEDAHHEIEAIVLDLVQIRRIALLEAAVREAELLGTRVAGLDEVAGDVDPKHVRPEPRLRQSRGPIAAPEVHDLEPLGDPQRRGQRLPALPHRPRDTREVPLLPQRLVRIHPVQPPFRVRWVEGLKARTRPTPDLLKRPAAGRQYGASRVVAMRDKSLDVPDRGE